MFFIGLVQLKMKVLIYSLQFRCKPIRLSVISKKQNNILLTKHDTFIFHILSPFYQNIELQKVNKDIIKWIYMSWVV